MANHLNASRIEPAKLGGIRKDLRTHECREVQYVKADLFKERIVQYAFVRRTEHVGRSESNFEGLPDETRLFWRKGGSSKVNEIEGIDVNRMQA